MIGKKRSQHDIFSDIAKDWWKPNGSFRILHKFNRIRIPYIENVIANNINMVNHSGNHTLPLTGISVLDIGCGGGLISEALTKKGAEITGIDTNPSSIKAAQKHALSSGLNINYIKSTMEEFSSSKKFDVVLMLEVLEHVEDLPKFITHAAINLKPGGIIIFSTINHTLKALIFGKLIAEYVLKWLPAGIHEYKKFIKPFVLQQLLLKENIQVLDLKGIKYNPIQNKWHLNPKPDINYIGFGKKIVENDNTQ